MKSVGFLAIGGILLILLIIVFISRVRFGSKNVNQVAQQQVQQEVVQDVTEEAVNSAVQDDNIAISEAQQSVPVGSGNNINVGDLVLTEIPSTVKTSMGDEVLQTVGVISGFKRYVSNGQVVYCIYINVNLGGTSRDIEYFCNYQSYKSVNKGDSVNVQYQLVDKSYISVLEISR